MLRQTLKNFQKTSVSSFLRHYSKVNSSQRSNDTKKIDSSTIDKVEISHFSNYSKEWWDENGTFKPLHSMNTLRVPFVRDGLINSGEIHKDAIYSPKPLHNVNILDVGCGGGILTESLARLGATVTGLDACKELIDCASLHSKNNPNISDNISYVYQTIEEHCTDENLNKYDSVIASEIVEHVTSQKLFVESCCAVLKPGGSIFMTTMSKTNFAWLAGILIVENVLGIVPKGTHDWEKFITPQDLQKLLAESDCHTKTVNGMMYNFILNQWLWWPDTSISYAVHAIKKQ